MRFSLVSTCVILRSSSVLVSSADSLIGGSSVDVISVRPGGTMASIVLSVVGSRSIVVCVRSRASSSSCCRDSIEFRRFSILSSSMPSGACAFGFLLEKSPKPENTHPRKAINSCLISCIRVSFARRVSSSDRRPKVGTTHSMRFSSYATRIESSSASVGFGS